MKTLSATGFALLLAGCAQPAAPLTCPDPAAVAPPAIGTPYIHDLTARLAGPDRENSIALAIAEIHARAPVLDSMAVTDILIAADCPNSLAQPDDSDANDRARIAAFRAQVDQIIGQ